MSVEDISLSSINYETCNPFRHNFSAATLPGRLNKSEDRIVSNIDKLHQEITRLEKIVRARLGIKKEHEGVYTLDAYNNNDCTYFDLDLPNFSEETLLLAGM
ncbi:septum formation initiator family protein [Pseudomonas aeruginosa]